MLHNVWQQKLNKVLTIMPSFEGNFFKPLKRVQNCSRKKVLRKICQLW